MKTRNILTTIISILITISSFATSYTWSGAIDSVYAKNNNWTPSTGYPGANDTAIIVSQTNTPTLAGNQTVTRLVITSGAFDLNGHEFTIQGTSEFSGGDIVMGSLIIRGTAALFTATTFSTSLDVYCDRIELSGGIFNESCIFTTTGQDDSPGSGGCVFNDEVTIVHNGSSKKAFRMGMTAGDEFNGILTITNSSNGRLSLSEDGNTFFNDHLVLNNSGTSIIEFSHSGGMSVLANDKTITIGTTGYAANELILYRFNQIGAANQMITLTGTAKLYLKGCEFNGEVTITAPELFCGNTIFNSNCQLIKTGPHTNYWYGDNIFNGVATITNQGDGGAGDELRLAATLPNFYSSNAIFQSTGKPIQVVWEGGSEFKGDISKNDSSITFKKGITTLNGSVAQSLYGTVYFDFNDLIIDKPSEHVTANTPVEIIGLLDLTSGNLVTDSVNLLTMTAGSYVQNASNNSFVAGPVKKVGNTAFEFPVGDDELIRKLTISASDSSSDAFIAQYYGGSQNISDSMDTTLKEVSYCNYWYINRIIGTSNVNLSLPWDTSFCAIFDTSNMRIAKWDSTKWVDKGHGTITGNSLSGKMTIDSVGQFGYFTHATTMVKAACVSCTTWTNTSSSALNLSTYTSPVGACLYIVGTFTVNQNFVFLNCPDIRMADDARIVIDAGKTLSIDNSRITPCGNYQWDYIKISGNLATLNMTNTHITGADTAIWSDAGGVFHVARRTFINRCYKGIMIGSYNTAAHTGTISNSWIGCATLAGGTLPALLFSPHATTRTIKGMHVYDATSLTIGTTPSTFADVNFYNSTSGIDGYNTALTVRNCNFNNMDNNGIGVKSWSPTGTFPLVVGNGIANSCNFRMSTFGVQSDNINSTVSNNNFFRVDFGIHMTNGVNRTLIANLNRIDLFNIGIAVYSKAKATVTINNNYLNAPGGIWLPVNLSFYGNAGIQVHNSTAFASNVTVNDNWITNTRRGISFMNINNLLTTPLTASNNSIRIQLPYNDFSVLPNSKHQGMRFLNCTRQRINTNSITRAFSTQTNIGSEWRLVYGIFGSFFQNANMCANIFTNISSGINYRDISLFSLSSCGNFNECYRGIDIGESELPGPTGISASISSVMPPFKSDSWNANTANDAFINRIFGISAQQIKWAFITGTTIANAGFPNITNTISIYHLATNTYTGCCAIPLVNDYDREGLIGPIVADTIIYHDYKLQRRYAALTSAFGELYADTNLLHLDINTDTTYINFYNLFKTSNIAKFIYVEKLIYEEDFSAAVDSLAAITDTNNYESNRKVTLELYLEKYVIGEAFSGADSTVLLNISNECAIVGGPAVYEARAMLNLEVLDTCLTGINRSSYYPSNILNSIQKNIFKIQPNPASTQIRIYHDEDITKNLDLIIRDGSGRIVMQSHLDGLGGYSVMNIEKLNQGLYIYEININKEIQQAGKFVIKR